MESASRIPVPTARAPRHSRSRTENGTLARRGKAALVGTASPGGHATLAKRRSMVLSAGPVQANGADTSAQAHAHHNHQHRAALHFAAGASNGVTPPPALRHQHHEHIVFASGSGSSASARNRAQSFSAHPSLASEPMSLRSSSTSGLEAAEEKLQQASALFDFARKRPGQAENVVPSGAAAGPSSSPAAAPPAFSAAGLAHQTPSKSAPDLGKGRLAGMHKAMPLREISSPSLLISPGRDPPHAPAQQQELLVDGWQEWAEELAGVEQSPAHFKAHRLAVAEAAAAAAGAAERSRSIALEGATSAASGSSSVIADDSGLAFPSSSSMHASARRPPHVHAGAPVHSTPHKRQHRLGVGGGGGNGQSFGPRQRSSLANEAFAGSSSDAGSAASSPSAAPSSARSQRVGTEPGLSPYRNACAVAESPLKRASAASHPHAHGQHLEPLTKFSTPQFKNVKPLQAAFMSTGLVSKRNRARPDLTLGDLSSSGDASLLQPLPPRPNFSGNAAATLGLREVVAAASAHQAISSAVGANTSVMPDTPVKKPAPAIAFKQKLPQLPHAHAHAHVQTHSPAPPHTSLRTHLGIPERPSSRCSSSDGSESLSPILPPHSPLLQGSACDSPTLGLMAVDQNALETVAARGWPVLDGSGAPKPPLVTPEAQTPTGAAGSVLANGSNAHDNPDFPSRFKKQVTQRPVLSRSQGYSAATPALSLSGLAGEGATDSSSSGSPCTEVPPSALPSVAPSPAHAFNREPLSFLANRTKFMRHRSRPLSVQGLQRKTSMTTEQAAAAFAGTSSGHPDGSAASPSPNGLGLGMSLGMNMGIGPVPMTPTRNHTPIKWFEAAQLVTTPSPTSHTAMKERERERERMQRQSRNSRAPLILSTSTRHSSSVGKFESSFNVQCVLGTGEFSEVLKVEDRATGYISAVKRMKRPFGGPRDRMRRMEEVDILRHLQRDGTAHRNVINLLDAWEEGGHLFLQTELCGLGTLAFFLEEYGCMAGNLDEPRLWKILAELSAGLQHIHNNCVIHLDLKPANVLITEVGSLKIGDFGFATRWPRVSPSPTTHAPLPSPDIRLDAPADELEEELVPIRRRGTKKHSLEREGDREYLAPEIMGQGRYGKEADVFSLGLIMLEAGGNVVLPDNGEAWLKLRNDDFTDVDLSHLSDQLVELIFGMLDLRPEARPSIDDIVQHPVMRAVQRRMALGVLNSELDQLPDFELPTIESGPLIGLTHEEAQHASGAAAGSPSDMDTTDDCITVHPSPLPASHSAPAMRTRTPGALGLTFSGDEHRGSHPHLHGNGSANSEAPHKVMDIRGALIAEPQDEFMHHILACASPWDAGHHAADGAGHLHHEQHAHQLQSQQHQQHHQLPQDIASPPRDDMHID